MTTETIPNATIRAWSENLEEDLIAAGMEQAQAHAYRQAFELGMVRVISQTATRQELQGGLAGLRSELRDDFQREIDRLERWLLLIGTAAIGLLTALVVANFT